MAKVLNKCQNSKINEKKKLRDHHTDHSVNKASKANTADSANTDHSAMQ